MTNKCHDGNTWHVISEVWVLFWRSWAEAGMQPHGKGRSRARGKHCLIFWPWREEEAPHLSRPANSTCFSPETLGNLVKQENKGSSLPWPPACSASQSCRRASCSSCILERTKHRTVTLPGAGHVHPRLQADPFDPRHMEK